MTEREIIEKVQSMGFNSKYIDISTIDPQKNPQDYFIYLCDVFYWLAHKNSSGNAGEVLGIEAIIAGLINK